MEKNNPEPSVVGVIGIGYVGLPLAICFADVYTVYGYDNSTNKIGSLKQGRSYIEDVSDSLLQKYLDISFFPTNDPDDLAKCDYILIAVPTPIKDDKTPDLAYVISATETVASILRKGQTIVLESTTYPGTVDEVMKPILSSTGLEFGKDFFLAYSPERIDPGNKTYTIYTTPKVVGGMNDTVTKDVASLYQRAIEAPIVTVGNIQTAEATKIFENIFRAVNIALVNELSLVFDNMGIDTWEVVHAASSKPMGFLAHYPGIGVGGHCIPVDPFYLSYKARKNGHMTRFIELAGEINDYMPIHTSYLCIDAISRAGIRLEDASVCILGMAYKPDTCDTRDSPSIGLLQHIRQFVGNVSYYDPYIQDLHIDGTKYVSLSSINEALDCDCIVIAVPHNGFKTIGLEEKINASCIKCVVDGANVLNSKTLRDSIHYLSIGHGDI